MCTVTAIKHHGEFFITSNRDEEPSRNALGLHETYSLFGEKVVFPQEPSQGGTWIALSENGNAACLLNGAFSPYLPKSHYRMSRGLMLLKCFDYQNAEEFNTEFDFDDIAPFTMVIYSRGALFEIVWDGTDSHFSEVDDDYSIWSSVQLYQPSTRIEKKERFTRWASEHSEFNSDAIINFHLQGHPDFLIENERVKTVSVTNLAFAEKETLIKHKDLVENREFELNI